jgi:hypothetical protein
MKSHFSVNGSVAMACAVAGASTMLNGNCSAQTFIAADCATNSTYAGGWSAGQNGGYGFGSWSMNYTEASSPIEADMDRTSPFDPFGVAWTLYNPEGSTPSPTSPGGQCVNPPTGTDISRAGRAMPNGGLQVGQTFSTVIANPSGRTFFRGYTIVLSTGSDNIQYGSLGQQLAMGTFEYFSYGKWYTSAGTTSLLDTDSTTNGMQVDIALTSTNTYHVVMTPLGNPGIAYSVDGTLENKGLTDQGPVNWVTYQLYNTDSDFYPSLASCGPLRTDFYIQSMTVAWALNIQKVGADVQVTWPIGTLLEADKVTGPWTTNINTSPYKFAPGGSQKFFRLQTQ